MQSLSRFKNISRPEKIMKSMPVAVLLLLLCPGFTFGIELKTGAQDSYPKFFLNDAGEMSGLEMDILRALEQEVPKLRFTGPKTPEISFVPWKRQQQLLEEGALDVMVGLAKTDARLKRGFAFTETPLYTVHNVMAVRADDPIRVSSFAEIVELGDNGIILALPGTATTRFLDQQPHPLKIDRGALTVRQNLRKLILKRRRFFFYHNLGLNAAIRHGGLTGQVIVLPARFRTYAHHMAFSPHVSTAVISRIENALRKLETNGELQRIYDRYTQ
jgi:ABC-type amino acid transport substrate-binding protein